MKAYYNEFEPYAAAWLRNLISAGLIPAGDVDTRSITEVKANEIKGYTQCHFFAGIGGWPLALRLAGFPDNKQVWTGSCPCQPFSANGKGGGFNDERDLWPVWFRLIDQCRPSIVFGEQVKDAISHGWIDRVYSDMEGDRYALGSATLPACGVLSPQKRERLWFFAHSGTPDALDGVDPTFGTQRHFRDLEVRYCENVEWIKTSDGRKFRNQSGLSLLAHGISGRVGPIRAYGNAIHPEVGARFCVASVQAMFRQFGRDLNGA